MAAPGEVGARGVRGELVRLLATAIRGRERRSRREERGDLRVRRG
jgi:hypothetical protein